MAHRVASVPATNLSVDRGDPFLELDELRDEQPEHLSSRFWNCVLIKVCPQPSYVPDALPNSAKKGPARH